MNKTYTLSVYNTCTGNYEDVHVTEEVYSAYKQTGWNIQNNNNSFYKHEIQFSQLIGGDDGEYENFREFITPGDTTVELALLSIRIENLHNIFPTLTEKEREILEYLYFEGYSAMETGELLGISKQAVNKRKRAAFEKIREDKRFF